MDQGTIATWVQLPMNPADGKGQFLLGTGRNNPDWTFTAMDKGKLSLVIKKGRSPYEQPGEYSTSLNVPINDWQADTWHHIAITWQVIEPGQSVIQIYLDRKHIEQRNSVTLSPLFTQDQPYIGQSSANGSHKATLNLHELYLSRRVLSD